MNQQEPRYTPSTPGSEETEGEFAHWIDEKSEALRFRLSEKFQVPAPGLATPVPHQETSSQNLEEVLLEHESPSPALLEELAALSSVPPLPDEELDRQALTDGGSDGDAATPE
jgi:hypothetical protein